MDPTHSLSGQPKREKVREAACPDPCRFMYIFLPNRKYFLKWPQMDEKLLTFDNLCAMLVL